MNYSRMDLHYKSKFLTFAFTVKNKNTNALVTSELLKYDSSS